jgi:hypothetical protein
MRPVSLPPPSLPAQGMVTDVRARYIVVARLQASADVPRGTTVTGLGAELRSGVKSRANARSPLHGYVRGRGEVMTVASS